MSVCVCVCQVAGRLHVEVWRGTEGSEEKGPGQFDTQQSNTDGDLQERKLDCVVRAGKCSFINRSVYHVSLEDIQENPTW